MGKVSMNCVTDVEDVQVETLKDEQALNVGSMAIPVGIESQGYTFCQVSSIEEDGDKTVTEDLGNVYFGVELDEGAVFTDIEVSDDLPENLQEHLDIGVMDLQ